MKYYSDVDLKKLPPFFLRMLDEILDKEGEWSDDRHDHKTRYGIRQLVADACGYTGELRQMSREDAKRCWAIHSWYGPRYDIVAAHSLLVCSTMIDTGGPAGVSQSIRHFQRFLNSVNRDDKNGNEIYGQDLEVDGLLGMKSSARLREYLVHRGLEGEQVMAVTLNCMQASHFLLTSERNEGKRDFTYGWYKRRVLDDLAAILLSRAVPASAQQFS